MDSLQVFSDKNDKKNLHDFITRANAVTVPIHKGCIIKKKNIYNVAYTWSPEVTTEILDLNMYYKLIIPTLHIYAYQGFFKPTIAEVLHVLPTELIELVEKSGKVMYYTTRPLSYDLNEVIIGNYHIGITTLYLNKSIDIEQISKVDLLEKYKCNSSSENNKFTDAGEFVANTKCMYNYIDYSNVLLIDKICSSKSISELLNEQVKYNIDDKYINKFFVKSVTETKTYVFHKVSISNGNDEDENDNEDDKHITAKKQRIS